LRRAAAGRLVATSGDEAATLRFGASLAERLRPDGVLLLSGDLGAGKTVLTRGLAAALGVAPEEVQSPTFTLVREHLGEDGRPLLTHVDLYRLEPDEALELGLEELLSAPGVKGVEWAERLPFAVAGALHLELVRCAGGREIRQLD
jgi:tRNA threonylcarbamoyladenosine biosynthesis protein TsaE